MRPYTLGVTGGIGSGKTTVCRLLEAHGARVFYADLEAKRLMQEDAEARAAITAAFGAASYAADGTLNRPHLAEQVFGDAARLEHLNRIVHPRVFAAFERAREQAAADGVEVLVHESAILFESGGDRHVDAVLVVDAPRQARIDRVVARDATSAEAVSARMNHQLPPEELRARADFVVENAGSLADLERQVDQVWRAVRKRAASAS